METETIDKAWTGTDGQEVCVQRVPEGRRGRRTRARAVDPNIGKLTVDAGNTRPVPVPRSRKKRRLALAVRGDIQADPPQIVRLRRGRDGGPTAIEKAEWVDPDDIRPNQRTGRVVRGFIAGGCVLTKIQRVSREITTEHIRAAEYIRLTWDVARIGFQAVRDGLPANQVVYLPRFDFSGGAHAQVAACREFIRIWGSLSPQQQRMASIIILSDYTIPYWCRCEERRTGVRPNEKIELGKLSFMMESLAEFLKGDIDDAIEKNRMRA